MRGWRNHGKDKDLEQLGKEIIQLSAKVRNSETKESKQEEIKRNEQEAVKWISTSRICNEVQKADKELMDMMKIRMVM